MFQYILVRRQLTQFQQLYVTVTSSWRKMLTLLNWGFLFANLLHLYELRICQIIVYIYIHIPNSAALWVVTILIFVTWVRIQWFISSITHVCPYWIRFIFDTWKLPGSMLLILLIHIITLKHFSSRFREAKYVIGQKIIDDCLQKCLSLRNLWGLFDQWVWSICWLFCPLKCLQRM